jgi:hypothetical protein
MDEEQIKGRVIFGTASGSGYGKPPEHSRFKKGQSGNPNGRPKKAASGTSLADQPTLSAILDAASRIVPVREGGILIQMSMRDALVNATCMSAVKGNARSQALVLDLLRKGDAAKAEEIRRSNELWREYKRIISAEIAEAKKQGLPVPKPLPHPDDVVIDERTGPKFLGPLHEQAQAMLEQTLRCRDTLIMQDALDRRSAVRLDGTPLAEPGAAEFLAILFDKFVPPRLRLSSAEWACRSLRYEDMPKRKLLKLLFEAWQKLGSPRPRGYVSADLSATIEQVESIASLLQYIQTHNLDPDRMGKDEWQQVIDAL